MSKVEGHAEVEQGSEEVFVQARSYGNLIKRQKWKCLYTFMSFFLLERISKCAITRFKQTAYRGSIPEQSHRHRSDYTLHFHMDSCQ